MADARAMHGFAALAAHALRRTASPATAALLGLWLALLATRDWLPAGVRLAGEAAGIDGPLAAAQARAGVLGAALAVLAPLVLWRAVDLQARVQGPERAGLAATPLGPAARQFALWLGVAAAAGGAALAVALAAELATGGTGGGVRPVVGRLDNPPLTLVAAGQVERFALPPLPAAARRLQAELVALPAADPTATARLSLARRDGSGAPTAAGRTLSGRRPLDVDLPRGAGALVLTLERPGEGAGLALPRGGILVLGAPAAPLAASLALAARAWLGLALAAALLPLLRRALSSPLAGALLVALWIPAWRGAAGLEHLPGGDLFAALDLVARGLSPGPPAGVTLLATALVGAAALALAGYLEHRRGGGLA